MWYSRFSVPFITTGVNLTRKKIDSHPEVKITQSMVRALPDGYRKYLVCVASVGSKNTTHPVDIHWSGVGLHKHSLWATQSHVTKKEGYIERKLLFKPWLSSHAGMYTCSVVVKDQNNVKSTVKKQITVGGT